MADRNVNFYNKNNQRDGRRTVQDASQHIGEKIALNPGEAKKYRLKWSGPRSNDIIIAKEE